ncbi:MAG: 2-amino-4-hydroxy-6-hydroxymethyldihydropteridine diphosphokinase [Pedobacter sp.]|nr:MAG: 2-amino-4-hydroxy-6-hydroxymethyldihydropteridine diphosphokinase [Pedobacter sp.]
MQLDNNTVYLLLGSNLGRREEVLKMALTSINERVGAIIRTSSIYETAAWGKTDQPNFLNIAVEVKTELTPIDLLDEVLSIESDLGRVRYEKWGARVIDIDIILYEAEIINIAGRLQIPHPEMQHRKFVLEPLNEIASSVVHPIFLQDIATLLASLDDELSVAKQNVN